MSKIRMDAEEIDKIRNNVIINVEEFSKEASVFYDEMNMLMSNPSMKAKFLNNADQIIQDVKRIEKKLISCMEDLTVVMKEATEQSHRTEEEFSQKFKDITSNDFNIDN